MLYYNQFIKENLSDYNDVELPPGYTTANIAINGKSIAGNNVDLFGYAANTNLNIQNSVTGTPSMLNVGLNSDIDIKVQKIHIIKIINSDDNLNVDIYFTFFMNDEDNEVYFGNIKKYGSKNSVFNCANLPFNFTQKNKLQLKTIITNAVNSWICPSEGKYRILKGIDAYGIYDGKMINLEPGKEIMVLKKNLNTKELTFLYNENEYKIIGYNFLLFNYNFSKVN